MTKIPGYAGYILAVDLNALKHEIKDLPKELAENYIGGKGFGAKILYDELSAGCNPLSPENMIVLATGPPNRNTSSQRVPLCDSYKKPSYWNMVGY